MPVQALPGFLAALSDIEPLHQILAGVRSIMYFGAQGDAGLTRGLLTASLGLVFWLAAGAAIVRWYDHRRLYRINPDAFAQVSNAVQDYAKQQGTPPPGPSGPSRSPSQSPQPEAT